MTWVGEADLALEHRQLVALRAHNLLMSREGSIEWSGLEVVCEHLEVPNVDELIEDLLTIRLHSRRPAEADADHED